MADRTIDLWHMKISVSLKNDRGVRCFVRKHLTRETDKSFVAVRLTETQEQDGYFPLISRVQKDTLLKPEMIVMMESSIGAFISGNTYCLRDQRKTALENLRAEIEKRLNAITEAANELKIIWDTDAATLENK